jgi:hypothetical protein
MSDLYVLASIPDQGKTTTAIALEKKLRSEGKRVACLQNNKGKNDVHHYLFKNCYHYSIPLEATQKRSAFEQWVPDGYDAYIMEVTMAYSPFGAVYVDLFENVNEIISNEAQNHWKEYVNLYYQHLWAKVQSGIGPFQDLMGLWEHVRNRNLQPVITKTPAVLEGPCVDIEKQLHHEQDLAVEKIQPKMALPKSDKNVIAVGAFPAEFWDIFPALRWFRFNYAEFNDGLRKEKYDLVIVGACASDELKLQMPHSDSPLICYQPSVFLELEKQCRIKPFSGDYPTLISRIKSQYPGTPLVPEGEPYSGYNNRYWVRQDYSIAEPVWKNGNTVFCDGWVLPQYLIRDGYLEVN